MFTAVYEREREFALQRALGWRPRDIARTVLVESAILGAVGAATATPIGVVVGLTVKLPIELQLGWGIPFVFPALQVVGTTAAAIAVAVAASVYPSGVAARVNIVGALRSE